jgi:hypothetical protein
LGHFEVSAWFRVAVTFKEEVEVVDITSYRLAVGGVAVALVTFLITAGVIVAVGHTVPPQYWSAGSAVGGALLGILAPTPTNALSRGRRSAGAAHRAAADASRQVAQQALELARAGGADTFDAARLASAAATDAETHAGAAVAVSTYIPALALFVLFASSTAIWLQGGVPELKVFSAASGTALIGLLAPSPAKKTDGQG